MIQPNGKEIKLPPRREAYKNHVGGPPLPPLDAPHLFEWLMEIGPTDNGAMGRGPISWTAIRDWKATTFKPLSAWEARLLRKLSVEYLTESHLAEDNGRQPPWMPESVEIDHEANERQLRAVLG